MKRHEIDHQLIDSLVILVKNLNDESRAGALVVVEGKRDVEALKAIGFEGEVFTLSHRGKLVELVSDAEKYRKTILLLDFDHKGRILTKKAGLLLQQKKNRIDLRFRKELASITRGRVKHVEELGRYGDYLRGLRID